MIVTDMNGAHLRDIVLIFKEPMATEADGKHLIQHHETARIPGIGDLFEQNHSVTRTGIGLAGFQGRHSLFCILDLHQLRRDALAFQRFKPALLGGGSGDDCYLLVRATD